MSAVRAGLQPLHPLEHLLAEHPAESTRFDLAEAETPHDGLAVAGCQGVEREFRLLDGEPGEGGVEYGTEPVQSGGQIREQVDGRTRRGERRIRDHRMAEGHTVPAFS